MATALHTALDIGSYTTLQVKNKSMFILLIESKSILDKNIDSFQCVISSSMIRLKSIIYSNIFETV